MTPNHHPVSNVVRSRARTMRKKMTDAELKLWNELRGHRLMGLSFRRQLPVGAYIVDFACPSKRLIVEVDGTQHAEAEAAEKDILRTRTLEDLGWTVLRFWNDDVLRDVDNVCLHNVTVAGLTAADAARQGRQAGSAATTEARP
jgi:very-short-patch-repair endonuclease